MNSIKMLMIVAISFISLNIIAQENSKQDVKTSTENSTKTMYSCPMHKNVVSDNPGKCKECGMDLKKMENTKQVFTCFMKCEGDKTYDKPGKSPKCGMNLKAIKQNQDGHNH